MENNNQPVKKSEFAHLSAIGSAISLICFFMPWVGCGNQNVSGSDLGGSFWLVFLASAVSLGAFFFFRSKKALSKAKKIILYSSIFGAAFMLYKYIRFQGEDLHTAFEIKWGSIATLLGFIISMYGIKFLKDETPAENGNNEGKAPGL